MAITEVQKVINNYGERIVAVVKRRLKQGNKKATGDLINSINYKYSSFAGSYRVQITGLNYLINVDRGRRVGAKQPPIKPIVNWIVAKRLPIRNVGLNRDKAIQSMAFAIARNISKYGIKPFPILNTGKDVTKSDKFRRDISQAMVKDIMKEFKNIKSIKKQ